MFEIKLCSVCAGYQCKDHGAAATGRTMEVNQATMRACSDCSEYAPFLKMTTTQAGNVICAVCVKRREVQAGKRAQLSLLDQQPLF